LTFTSFTIMAFIALISWLNFHLLERIFRFYNVWLVKYAYQALTAITVIVVGYGLTKHPSFAVPEYKLYQLFVYISIAWGIGQLLLLVFQPILYVTHRLLRGKKKAAIKNTDLSGHRLTRREFLHSTLAVAPLIAFGISSKGIYEAQSAITIQRYSLSMPNLSSDITGFKIAQISDTHIGPYFGLNKLEMVLTQLKQEQPDLVVITGDLVDDLNLLKSSLALIDAFQPLVPHGIYYCYGNHEYFHNIDFVRAEINKSRLIALNNESQLIIAGHKPLYIMGVDYPWADQARTGINVSATKRQQYFATALKNVPVDAIKLLIAHHPDFLYDSFQKQVDLTLAGHTHGGQFTLFGKSLISSYAYMRGLYRNNGVYGYVSSGTGHWFPFRFNCPPEIGVFTLQA